MKVYFVSLGCDKNLVDSEVMLGLLRDAGHEITDDETEAEAAVINTCCFIHDAKEESINTIIELGELKNSAKLKRLVITGCLAERYASEMATEMPEVDVVLGTASYDRIVEAIEGASEAVVKDDLERLPLPETKRMLSTGTYVSYLKIAEGCDKHCTYCIIPKVRGNFRSVPMEYLLADCEHLAEQGVKELVIVAQETTLYGVDLYGKKMLPELLTKLCAIEGFTRIRLMYCYPEEITEELLQVMAKEPKICHYLDLPIQHASTKVLKEMGRRTSKEELLSIIAKIREYMPDVALRTSLITGFPGETEEDFEELKEFVEQVGFERLGVFAYSKEDGTPAAKRKDQIPKRIKEKRRKEIMLLQQKISKAHGESLVGQVLNVLVDGRIPDGAAYAVGDAIVILGGGMASASEIGNFGEMSDGADRVWRGARLWKAGKAPRLIATGDGCRASTAELLADLAVPTQAVTFLESARNTEEEVRQIAAAGVTNVLLVTSAWHMNRARLLFAKFAPALKVRPAPADFENSVSAACMRGLSDYLPQADALKRNSAAFREYVGYWGYRLFR